jgi:hypothetical protein
MEKMYSKVTRTLSQKVERDTSVMCVESGEMDVCVFLKDISLAAFYKSIPFSHDGDSSHTQLTQQTSLSIQRLYDLNLV